jgi:hypothetical protein
MRKMLPFLVKTFGLKTEGHCQMKNENGLNRKGISWLRHSLPFVKKKERYSEEEVRALSFDPLGWDEGLETIDSILLRSKKITKEQKEGLVKLRKFLVTSASSSRKTMHVPNTLLRASMNPTDSISRYLVEDFGGVLNNKKIIKKDGLVDFNSKKIGSNRSLELNKQVDEKKIENSSSNYCPPEWHELDSSTKRKLRILLSLESLSKWDFDIFQLNELCNGNSLLFISWALLGSPAAQVSMAKECGEEFLNGNKFNGYDFLTKFQIKPPILCNFIRTIESDYCNENPYHNNIHAADVTQTLHVLLLNGAKKYASDLESFSIFIASICHDVHHPGFNNNYHLNSVSDLAITYNDISVLENMSASRCFRLMLKDDEGGNVDILSGLCAEQVTDVRKIITTAILHTDMTKHFQQIVNLKAIIEANDLKSNTCTLDSNDSCTLLCFVLHAADISNQAKPLPLNELWGKRVLDEFFIQGDTEKTMGLPVSHLCDRDTTSLPESQIGFIQFIVQPTFELMESLIPTFATEVMYCIDKSKKFWENKK